ncbi:hypothetical protein OAG68_01850 [bacterium]|nr:hypothetical protein [bacterium]
MTGVNGAWTIKSVQVDAEEVVDEGFDQLVVTPDQIAIEPAGIELAISQSTTRSAILESRSDIYYAEFHKTENELTLIFTRPAFGEKVRLSACMN